MIFAPDYYCRGFEIRHGRKYTCPHIEFCKRYSSSSYHKYFPRLPVSPHCSCRAFRKKDSILVSKSDIIKLKEKIKRKRKK